MEIAAKIIWFAIMVTAIVLSVLFLIDVSDNEAKANSQEVELYFFGIDNCFACELQKPIIMQLKTQGFNFEIINATRPTPEVRLLLDKYGITKYPTIIIVTANNRVTKIVGFRPLKTIKDTLRLIERH